MGKLFWKHRVTKVFTEEERQRIGSSDSGVSWIKNMSEDDKNKYVASFKGSDKLIIQKTIRWTNLKIIIAKEKNHPEMKYHRGSKTYPHDEMVISIGQNGTSVWTRDELVELLEAIDEGIDYVEEEGP